VKAHTLMMKLTVLGCSGGIGGDAHRTTALLVDDDILIDAGTGVADLDIDALTGIDHVFLTHAHIDHIACLPLMLDTVGVRRAKPLIVHCTNATEMVLRAHLFNDALWPNFTRIPSPDKPFLRFASLEEGESCVIGARIFTALPAKHGVPAVGYQVATPRGSLVFSGDSTVCPAFWDAVARIAELRYLIVETAFPDAQRDLAIQSRHLCPSLLASQLPPDAGAFRLLISHMKPGYAEETMRELQRAAGLHQPVMLTRGQVYWI
jgi:ribonuclease BN (tRNA processing enzyme)